MCQLLAMNCNTPTDIVFSFTGFATRGGLSDEHKDGWGIAFFEGRGVRLFVDHLPACDSPVAALIKSYPVKSENVIAHIRKATQGEVSLENCHPFVRECWGQYWVFAHNGNLENFHPSLQGPFQPVGNTDSELAFCLILQRLRERFGAQAPDWRELAPYLAELCAEIAQHGTFNMTLSNGQALFSHCTTHLHYLIRQHPFPVARLADEEISVDFAQVTTPNDRVAVIVTEPLTNNEAWQAYQTGDCKLFQGGSVIWQANSKKALTQPEISSA